MLLFKDSVIAQFCTDWHEEMQDVVRGIAIAPVNFLTFEQPRIIEHANDETYACIIMEMNLGEFQNIVQFFF